MREDSDTAALDRQHRGNAGEAESHVPGIDRKAPSLLTPAKKAALDALEREFNAFLKNRPA